MFKIHVPQTIMLHTDGDAEDVAQVNFSMNGADTSRCRMDIISKGRTWTAIFNAGGALVEQSYREADEDENTMKAKPLSAADYMVDGRDTRADNPYTHVAPIDADTAYREALNKPFLPESKEHRALREKAFAEAKANAKKLRGEADKRADEKPEDRLERERKEREDRLAKAGTASPEPHITDRTFPDAGTQRSVAGRNADGNVMTNPDGSPMAPAPSSPMPGSPPPHPLDRPDPGRVNTAQSIGADPNVSVLVQ